MGFGSDDGESCSCPICLEPLSQPIIASSTDGPTFIGTTVPCGHCLHVHCWDQWTASSISRMQGRSTPIHVKCPLCNVPTTSFVRLYLNLNGASSSVLENDDDSIFDSETESEDDDDRIEQNGTDNSTRTKEIPSSASTKTNESNEKHEGNCGENVDSRSSKKYLKCKGMLRKLQHENKLLRAQYNEKGENYQQLQSKVQNHEEQLGALQLKVDQLEQLQQSNRLSMDGISYEMIQLKRDLQNLKSRAKEVEEQSKQKDIQMSELKQRYDQRIKDLQKKQENMKEVQHILMERPKLVEEVRSLREKLTRLQQQQQKSFILHDEGQRTIRVRKEIPKIQDIHVGTHKQRKRMLVAFREELEDSENNTIVRKKRATQEMRRIDTATPLAPPVNSQAKALVTELMKKPPTKDPSQIAHGKKLVGQFSKRSHYLSTETHIKSYFSLKQQATPIPPPPSLPQKRASPSRSTESSTRSTVPHRKQSTMMHFSKHFDKL